MLRTLTIAILALIAAFPPQPALAKGERFSYRTDMTPAPRNRELMRQIVLRTHNETRAEYGSAPLEWSDDLAASAQVYAQTLAQTRHFDHDPQDGAYPGEGENLFMGTRGAFSFAEMMAPLIEEKRAYKPGRFPDVSRTGDWGDVAHYTQIVWPSTRRVGCAIASNAQDDYLVCRYLPAGNVMTVAMR